MAKIRACIDTGADMSLITERVITALNIPVRLSDVTVSTYSGDRGAKVLGEAEVLIKPHFGGTFETTVREMSCVG